MRLTKLVAAIFILALAGYLTASTMASRAAAWPQESQGPLVHPQSGESPANQQDNSPSQQPLKVQTTVINVFATVRDKHNGIISDLTQNDFKIYEDGQEQKVAFFSKEVNMPITLGLLIDTSGSQDRLIGAEQDAASRFLKEVMRKRDEAMVISFD